MLLYTFGFQYLFLRLAYRKTSIKRRVPNNRWVSHKRPGSDACVLINAGSRFNAGTVGKIVANWPKTKYCRSQNTKIISII